VELPLAAARRSEVAAFIRRYAASLGDFLVGGARESGLEAAYALGRLAIAMNMGVIDISAVHGQALLSFVQSAGDVDACEEMTQRAGEFFSECMAAFEIVHRGYRETCAELGKVNRALRERAAELADAKELIESLAKARSAFLAEAGRRLSASLDFDQTLRTIADLAVPELAQWCAVDLVDPKTAGAIRRAAQSSAPGEVPLQEALSAGLSAAVAEKASRVVELEAMRGSRGLLCIPLLARGEVFAALELLGAEGGAWDAAAIDLAEELGRRASIALENARLLREAQEAVRVREEFLSLASHELRTPLTPLLIRLSIAARRSRGGEAVDPAVFEACLRQVHRLISLVNDLLDVGRIQAGKLELHFEVLSLTALAEEVRATFAGAYAARPLRFDRGREPALVRGDRARLEQVVTNLVENALKYSAEETPVDLSVSVEGRSAVLAVRDQGIGIPREQQKQIFERFFRAANAGSAGGSLGLGLFICRDIVERHGGAIRVESQVGRGSAFFVTLPLWAEPASAGALAEARNAP
jgi:signal transduction histidine kinase